MTSAHISLSGVGKRRDDQRLQLVTTTERWLHPEKSSMQSTKYEGERRFLSAAPLTHAGPFSSHLVHARRRGSRTLRHLPVIGRKPFDSYSGSRDAASHAPNELAPYGR